MRKIFAFIALHLAMFKQEHHVRVAQTEQEQPGLVSTIKVQSATRRCLRPSAADSPGANDAGAKANPFGIIEAGL
jgi:hypothetical protein